MSRLSANAYARYRNVSHVAVLKAIKSGRITRDADNLIDVEKADASWPRNTNPAQQRGRHAAAEQSSAPEQTTEKSSEAALPPAQAGGPSYAQSRAVREAYNARLAKLDYEERTGALVRIDTVKVAWFRILRVLRDRTMNLPDRLAPILASETDPKIVRSLLEEELRQILHDASEDISSVDTT